MIDKITFTGVDNRTPLMELIDLADQYPRAEFAVLVGNQTNRNENRRFPNLSTVRDLRELGEMGLNTSLHLCGRFSRAVVTGEGPSEEIYELCEGFGRVQLNLASRIFAPSRRAGPVAAVKRFARRFATGSRSVILQHRSEWSDVPFGHPAVEYLFDRSGGRGQAAFAHWPTPPRDSVERLGYAGGIGPDNIEDAMEFAGRYPKKLLWFDMETRVRCEDDWFDLDAIERVCRQVWG